MFTKRATELIQQHAVLHGNGSGAHPMFLYLALQAVHEPVEVPEVYAAPFAATIHDELRQTYAGMVAAVDECVFNVTNALRNSGWDRRDESGREGARSTQSMWDSSLLVVSSDNGGWVN